MVVDSPLRSTWPYKNSQQVEAKVRANIKGAGRSTKGFKAYKTETEEYIKPLWKVRYVISNTVIRSTTKDNIQARFNQR